MSPETALLTPAESEALLLSLRISAVAVLCALPFALAAALLLARHDFFGRSLVEGILHLPLALPPVVVGYLLLIMLGPREPLGAWLETHLHIRFAFSWTGAALASALITFPFQYRAIRLALQAQDAGLAEAAATLGAGPLDRFVNLILPLALPGIVAGAITAFAASLGEFGAIITFVSNIPGETRTLPLAIYSALQEPGGESEAARLAALSIALALIGVSLAGLADRRLRAALTA
ncbi:MAG TPA: molybdate ABC transporter permease subunit [Rhizomicrobium sp.]|nr:molybdate ABC transporter permease subunit [Rhizomicrobium sp.]